MPWDGSQNYYYPPGTRGIPDQTIESEAYNTFLDDLVINDLNTSRPISRGGTGGTSAFEAVQNLGAEKSQQIITNYGQSGAAWLSGSFYSAGGATDEPVTNHKFIGFVTKQDDDNMVLEAFDLDSTPVGERFIRIKKAGTWVGTAPYWTSLPVSLAADFVNVTGDTMTGDLAIKKVNPSLALNKGTGSGEYNVIQTYRNDKLRWQIFLGDETPETGSGNFGSNFTIKRFDDAGGYLSRSLNIARDTGAISLNTPLSGSSIDFNSSVIWINAPTVNFNSGGAVYFGSASATFSGNATVNGSVTVNVNVTANGRFYSTAKQNYFGGPGGHGVLEGLIPADANILYYDNSAGNWAGTGTDGSGNLWFRTGLSGTTGAGVFMSSVDQSLHVMSGTNAGDFNSGALIVSGGLGVGLNVHCNGIIFPKAVISGMGTTTGGLAGLEIRSLNASYGAFMAFHRPGAFATYFGVDSDNKLKVGGWSFGATVYEIWHTGNLEPIRTSGGTITGNLTVTGTIMSHAGVYSGSPGDLSLQHGGDLRYLFWGGGGYYLRWQASAGQLHYIANNATAWWSNFNGDFYVTNNLSCVQGWKPGGGVWADTSDERIKNVEGDYTRGLDEILRLRPVFFTFKGNDTSDPPTNEPPAASPENLNPKENRSTPTVPYYNSPHRKPAEEGKKFAGMIAQEVEAVIPEMVSNREAYIDGQRVTDLRDLDTTPLIYAMINAIKTLDQRIKTLEGA